MYINKKGKQRMKYKAIFFDNDEEMDNFKKKMIEQGGIKFNPNE